jgi:hypothetical protein
MQLDIGEMKRKSFSNPVPLEIYDHFEWKHTDVVIPPNLNYENPFIGATVNMLAPFHKESGKKAYFFRYRYGRCSDVRMKLMYNKKQYYNSVVLAYKLFPDSEFVKIQDNEVRILKLLDHIDPLMINDWGVKIDSETNLRLATLGENQNNSRTKDGHVRGLRFNETNGYVVGASSRYLTYQNYPASKYGGLNHAKLAALKDMKEAVEKYKSPFFTFQLKSLQVEIRKVSAQVQRIDELREKFYAVSFVELGDLDKIPSNSYEKYAMVDKQWLELIQKLKIRSNADVQKRINKIMRIKIFNKNKNLIHNVHYEPESLCQYPFKYRFRIMGLDYRSKGYSTALEAVFVGLEYRQELCRILGRETTLELTEEQIKIINSINYS